ncbi:hypothetical protein OH77DRAFT_151168 [Trametes cingulata]|nr:hypothetical protein OH77DRAFT_151168 [Trametes cingulata]
MKGRIWVPKHDNTVTHCPYINCRIGVVVCAPHLYRANSFGLWGGHSFDPGMWHYIFLSPVLSLFPANLAPFHASLGGGLNSRLALALGSGGEFITAGTLRTGDSPQCRTSGFGCKKRLSYSGTNAELDQAEVDFTKENGYLKERRAVLSGDRTARIKAL